MANFSDHTNMLKFYLSNLDRNTTPKIILLLVYFFFIEKQFKTMNFNFLASLKLKSIKVVKKNVLNGRFVLFEVGKKSSKLKNSARY